ncbi:MAG: 7-cyano-7-deazaguanine synthase QueC [Candidatus Margulisiibacteriota bacterium]
MTPPTNPGCVVLLSGGQDSATCLALALKNHPKGVRALGFDYGQRHKIELIQAQKLADLAGVPFDIITLDWLGNITHNALTKPLTIEATSDHNQLPNTFVDGRNHLFLSVAAVYAKQYGLSTLYTGVCQTDFSGYPDCRNDFIQSLEKTLSLAMAFPFDIQTPLMWLTKSQTVQLMAGLKKLAWYAETHTCYEGQRPACGECPACLLRKKGFEEAGIPDPLPYR